MLEKIQTFLRNRLRDAGDDGAKPDDARIAAAALLVEMSRADFNVNDTEVQAIERAGARLLRTDTDEARRLIADARERADDSVSLYDFTALIQDEFDSSQKREVVLELWRVAWADGTVDPHEEHLVRKVAGLLHVSHDDFIDAKLQARDERED